LGWWKTYIKIQIRTSRQTCIISKDGKYVRTDKYEHKITEFNITQDVEKNDFTPLINKVIDSNSSCLITGPPGAGKTTLINMIKEYLTTNDKNINI
jgi:nucleoside-triphosphatase THEP1